LACGGVGALWARAGYWYYAGLCFVGTYAGIAYYFALADSNSTFDNVENVPWHTLVNESPLSSECVALNFYNPNQPSLQLHLDSSGSAVLRVERLIGNNFMGQSIGTLEWKGQTYPILLPVETVEKFVRSDIEEGNWEHLHAIIGHDDLPPPLLKLASAAYDGHTANEKKKEVPPKILPFISWYGVDQNIQRSVVSVINSGNRDFFSDFYHDYNKYGIWGIQIDFSYSQEQGAFMNLRLTTNSLGLLVRSPGGGTIWFPTMDISEVVYRVWEIGLIANYRSTRAGDYLSEALKNVYVSLKARKDTAYTVDLFLSLYPRSDQLPGLIFDGEIELAHDELVKAKRKMTLRTETESIEATYDPNYGFVLPDETDFSGKKNPGVETLCKLIRLGK
jgi:hypothetical protein